MSTLLAITSIYVFIFLGFIAKKIFKDEIDERTLILISIYFLQPMLTFWGLTRAPIDYNLVLTPIIYFIVVTITLFLVIIFSKFLFSDTKDKSIFIATSLVGNTGNLAIPLGIALFGEGSVPYTSIINIANVFFIYTVSIYFFARSSFSLKESFLQMVKIPIIWFAIFALYFNYRGFSIHPQLDLVLQMGAYATIVLQLMIFGVYLSRMEFKEQNYKLSLNISFVKLILLPFIGLVVIILSPLSNEMGMILMISLLTPLAVNNVNIAALYKCKPYEVTNTVFISTMVFLLLIYFNLELLNVVFK